METLCIICLNMSTYNRSELCFRYFGLYHGCINCICDSCRYLGVKMNDYIPCHKTYKNQYHCFTFCCNACALQYYIKNNMYELYETDPILINQRDIHTSIFLHKYLDIHIISDVITVVIDYLIEN